MKLISFKDPIGRGLFTVFYILIMFIYWGAFYFLPESNFVNIFLRLILMLGSLAIYISIHMRRMLDIGKKRSEIYLLCFPVYNLYILFLLFTKKGNSFKTMK